MNMVFKIIKIKKKKMLIKIMQGPLGRFVAYEIQSPNIEKSTPKIIENKIILKMLVENCKDIVAGMDIRAITKIKPTN